MLQLVVPGLFTSIHALSATEASGFPALATLLARGRQQATAYESTEELLCNCFGVARQTDWPLAAITYAFDDGRPGNDYWLRADPVHVRIHRDRLILVDELDISANEAQALCGALASHFGEGLDPLPMQPDRWYLRCADDPRIRTTPLSQAQGQHIDPLLPLGPGAMHWRKLLNEAQMLLFEHPVNLAREARGLPSINSLWFWGGGILPSTPAAPCGIELYGRDFTARALAKFSGAQVHALPDSWSSSMKDDSLSVIDQIRRCWQRNDVNGWQTAMKDFEALWMGRLIKSGRRFRLDDPTAGIALAWHPFDKWKFWKRPKTNTRTDLGIAHGATPPSPTVDEFGNRC